MSESGDCRALAAFAVGERAKQEWWLRGFR